VVAVWLLLLGLLFANRQDIYDWWRLRAYTPPAAVASLAEQDTMTPYARDLFYLNRPQLLSSVNSFRSHCPQNENAVVLGCYHPGENGIYVYDVQDPKLQGVTQVTAAHEDLHAIYARLSSKDQTSVNKLLEDYYKNGLTDSQVKAEIEEYKKTEPGAVLDEMHSVFGTEVANLPAPLEAYYKKYFSNRAAIISYQQRYQAEFSSRRSAVARYDARLTAMKSQIDSQQAALDAQLKQINATKARLDDLRRSGDAAAYNAAVPGYNAQVSAYNAAVASLKILISQYNQLVEARNQLAGELNTLDKALDTRLNQQASQ
jgi:hypothetical protein